jgi:hypothetical protein
MDPTPECLEAVIQSSAVLRWLHDQANLTTLLMILLAELALHVYVWMRLIMGVASLMGWVDDGIVRLYRWCKFRRS